MNLIYYSATTNCSNTSNVLVRAIAKHGRYKSPTLIFWDKRAGSKWREQLGNGSPSPLHHGQIYYILINIQLKNSYKMNST